MNIKKVLAAVAAAAVAVSAMAVSAFAASVGVSYGTSYSISVPADSTATEATIALSGITTNPTANWNDWCQAVIAVTTNGESTYYGYIGAGVTFDVSYNETTIPYGECTVADSAGVGQVVVPVAAGSTIEVIATGWTETPDEAYMQVDSITLNDGTTLEGGTSVDVPTTTPDTTTDTTTDTDTTPAPETGATAVVALAGLAVAGAAAVASKRR